MKSSRILLFFLCLFVASSSLHSQNSTRLEKLGLTKESSVPYNSAMLQPSSHGQNMLGGSLSAIEYTHRPNRDIPDNDLNGITDTIVIPAISIGALRIRLDTVFHTYVGDLHMELQSPRGEFVTIFHRPGPGIFGSSGDNFINTVFSDTATRGISSIIPADAPHTGYWRNEPSPPTLAVFNGNMPAGRWIIFVADQEALDVGTLVRWSIIIDQTTSTTPPTILHSPVTGTLSTGNVVAVANITDADGIAAGAGAPRLWHKRSTDVSFTSVTPDSVVGANYYFSIPGRPISTTVQYYLAAQDASPNNNIATLPPGGSGINPPGSTPPPSFYSYTTGAQWVSQVSGVTEQLRSVATVSSSVGWVCGRGGTVLLTGDNGAIWLNVGNGSVLQSSLLYAIASPFENLAIVATANVDSTIIFRTTDYGSSWSRQYAQQLGFIDAIRMYNTTSGIAVGDPIGGRWTILRTANGGSTWSRISTEPVQLGSETGLVNCLATVGTTHIWFGTDSNRVYRSTDGGTTWSWARTTAPVCNAVWFNSTSFGVSGFSDGTIANTTDGGATWTSMMLPGSGAVTGITGAGTNDFWVTRTTTVYRSRDRGQTWSVEYVSPSGSFQHINFAATGSSGTGWAITNAGGIARFDGLLTGVAERTKDIPETFLLKQNYPNPFNPSTTIEYELPQESYVELRVFDILGRGVETLVHGKEMPGVHWVPWRAVDFSSGVYFYRLTAGAFVTTKKLLLLR